MGFVTMFANSINKKLLSWQLNNSSYTPENKPFVPINTAKCGTEDVARELSHGLAEIRWPMLRLSQ